MVRNKKVYSIMSKQNTVAVAVKTALGVTFETLKAQVDIIGMTAKKHAEEKLGVNQAFAVHLNTYFVTNYGIAKWYLEDTRNPVTLAQKQIRDTYNGLAKYYKEKGYKAKFPNTWAEARKYAPAMLLEGKEREAALAAIQAERKGVADPRSCQEVFTWRMKDDKKEWGDLAALYKTTARFYFQPEDAKTPVPEQLKPKLRKTMGALEEALRAWGIDPATVLTK